MSMDEFRAGEVYKKPKFVQIYSRARGIQGTWISVITHV